MYYEGRAEKGDVLALGLNFLRIATQDPQIPYLMKEVGTVQQWKEDLSKIAKDHPLKQLIQDCLKDNVEKRPTVNDVCRQLSNCGVLNLYKELKKNESKVINLSLIVYVPSSSISYSSVLYVSKQLCLCYESHFHIT